MPSERDAVDAAFLAARNDSLRPVIALGLAVISKWDRANTAFVGGATASEAIGFDSFTDAEFREFDGRAAKFLQDHVALTVEARRPSFWLPVLQSLIAAFIYSVLLITIYVIVKFGGRDLIDIAREVLTRPS